MSDQPAQAAGVIHDIGYRNYTGNRLGRSYAVRSLFTHSLRAAWGLGRGARAKIVPWLMGALAVGTAVIWAIVEVEVGERISEYDVFPTRLQLPIIIFVAVQSVELLSHDLRHSVLPLYFARPIRRDDYVIAKLAALAGALAILIATPVLLFYTIIAFNAESGSAIWAETKDAAGGVLLAIICAIVLAALGLAIASLAARRVFAIGGIVAFYLVTAAVYGIIDELTSGEPENERAGLLAPFPLLDGFFAAIRGQETDFSNVGSSGWMYVLVTIALLASSIGLLIARYRRAGR